MTSKHNTLTNCPRCGEHSSFLIQENEFSLDTYYEPFCTECGLRGIQFDDRDEAIKWWENRPLNDEVEDLKDDLYKKLQKLNDKINMLINQTPTGEVRNAVTDINIAVLEIAETLI